MTLDNEVFFALVSEQIAEGHPVTINLKGCSMAPTLREGDEITLSPLGTEEPRIGDVLLFVCNGHHVVHRLVRREGDRYILQGDNNISFEVVLRDSLLARLTQVRRSNGHVITVGGDEWQRISRRALRRKPVKNLLVRWLSRESRKRLRPWYFVALAILMWAPLNGVGIPLNNYVLGLRLDHFLHASVFIPCSLFVMDLFRGRRGWITWLCAVGVGVLTESVQYLLPYRGFDINDMVANFCGISLGWMAILIMKRKTSK